LPHPGLHHTYQQGKALGSIPGSLRGCPPPAQSAGRTSPRTCGTRRRSPSSRLPFAGCGRQLLSTSCVPNLLSKTICICGGGGRLGGVRTGCWKKRYLRRLTDANFLRWKPYSLQRAPSSQSTAASARPRLTHNILAKYHSRTGPHM